MAATKNIRYARSEDQQAAAWETMGDVDSDDAPQAEYAAGPDAAYEEGRDPDYDEVTHSDYDEAAQPEYELAADPDYELSAIDEVPEPTAVVTPAPRAAPQGSFAYEVGHPVLPATQQQAHAVVWRGQLKERHPATGLVQRTNVYRLGDGFWDCYREDELQAA